MKFSTRELVTMAVFGALWGLVEISLGSVFHAIDLPLTGMALAIIGVMVASIGTPVRAAPRLDDLHRRHRHGVEVVQHRQHSHRSDGRHLHRGVDRRIDFGRFPKTIHARLYLCMCRRSVVDIRPAVRDGCAAVRAQPAGRLARSAWIWAPACLAPISSRFVDRGGAGRLCI